MKKQKIESIVVECSKIREEINLSNKEERNYKSDIKDETDLD